MLTLSVEDGQAVDVLLDRHHSGLDGGFGNGFGNGFGAVAIEAASESLKGRVQCAGQILGVLDEMPVGEPPKYLVHRIMQAVRERPTGRITAATSNNSAALTETQAQG
jgi:hypothetical protein